MIYSISTKKLIREMDSRELEDHLLKLWIEVDKNTGLLLLNHPDLKLIQGLTRLGFNRFAEEYFLTFCLTAFHEVDGAVNAPQCYNNKSDVRFLPTHASNRERPNEVKEHDDQIRQQSEDRDD